MRRVALQPLNSESWICGSMFTPHIQLNPWFLVGFGFSVLSSFFFPLCRRILHRDLKSKNVFLKNNQLKIGKMFQIPTLKLQTSLSYMQSQQAEEHSSSWYWSNPALASSVFEHVCSDLYETNKFQLFCLWFSDINWSIKPLLHGWLI